LLWRTSHKCNVRLKEADMNTAKEEVRNLLNKLPEDCSVEDIQYHLYVIGKTLHGLKVAEEQGTFSQDEAETSLKKWLAQ
jgi:hypothetical protein